MAIIILVVAIVCAELLVPVVKGTESEGNKYLEDNAPYVYHLEGGRTR